MSIHVVLLAILAGLAWMAVTFLSCRPIMAPRSKKIAVWPLIVVVFVGLFCLVLILTGIPGVSKATQSSLRLFFSLVFGGFILGLVISFFWSARREPTKNTSVSNSSSLSSEQERFFSKLEEIEKALLDGGDYQQLVVEAEAIIETITDKSSRELYKRRLLQMINPASVSKTSPPSIEDD